jgi:hypothetical protein
MAVAVVDGCGTGLHAVVVAIVLERRFGLTAAALVLAATAVGRLLSPVLAWVSERSEVTLRGASRRFSALIVVMVVSSAASMAAAIWWSPLVTAGLLTLWAMANYTTTAQASVAAAGRIMQFGPLGIVGVCLGAFAGTGVLELAERSVPAAVAVAAVVVGVQLGEPRLLSGVLTPAPVATQGGGEAVGYLAKGFVLAALAYGPLVIYASLATSAASLAWVGWAMASYAAGALWAGWLDRRLRAFDQWPGPLVWAALGVAPWIWAVSGPLMVSGRFLSGACLFVAQGRLLRQGLRGTRGGPPSATRVAATQTGLGIGASVGSVLAAGLAQRWSVPVMGATLAATTTVVAAVAAVVESRRRVPDS